MRNFRMMLFLVPVISLVFLFCSCASSGNAISNEIIDFETDTSTNAQNKSDNLFSNKPSKSTSTKSNTTSSAYFYFEETLENWIVSDYENEFHGELAFTKAFISSEQKMSGKSSAALYCDFKGVLGNSKYAQGVFRINFTQPQNLKGKTIATSIYIPEELVSPQFKASSYGLKLYIKTGLDYSWSDGGIYDIANNLKAGWNRLSFSPVDVNEHDTYELGIQMTKGETSADWSGIIYVDDFSY